MLDSSFTFHFHLGTFSNRYGDLRQVFRIASALAPPAPKPRIDREIRWVARHRDPLRSSGVA